MTGRALVRRHGDLVLGVGLAVLLLLELATWHHAHTDKAVAGPAGVGAALALCLRRRTPLGSFVLCLTMQAVASRAAPYFFHEAYAVLAIFLVNLYSLGAHARGLEAWLGLVGLGVNVAGLAAANGDHDPGSILFSCLLCGLPWGTGVTIRLRVERLRELARLNADLEARTRAAVAEERARIARELHDVVSHALAVTILQARGARRVLGRDEDAVRRAFGAIEQTNRAALADMRRLLTLLRAADDDPGRATEEPAPSLERLDDLLEQVRSSGLPVQARVVGDPLPLPPGLDLSAYRIVQEALTNVLKHAGPAASAHVEIGYGAEELRIDVVNRGVVPARPTGRGGHGLIGLRERGSVAQGSVTAGPEPGGYAVRARMPYLTDLVAASGAVRSR